ncbi:hypothetical protein G9A89_021810 [Geosiphon pyriformis]|nr:hypothetical protein G9A89_021810 [Geosiphon pyriformis]
MGMTAHNLSNLVQSYGKKTCYIFKNSVSYAQAHCAVICFDSEDVKETAICSTPVFKGVNLIWAVTILALHISVLECSLENMSDQMANISCKLDKLLAVLSVSFTVPPTPKHNPVLDMTVNTLLFVSPVPSVVTAISQDISPSGFCVLTVKVDGLKANLAVLENSIKIVNKFSGVKVFTLGLDAGFLGVGITLIMNENLAKHVSKISEILSRLLMVCLLFKNKQSVSVLGLYAEAFLDECVIQAGLINSFIAKACNKSTFVILGGNFNKNGNKHSFSFSKCIDLSLVNTLVNSFYIKTSTWRNSRGVEKTIDYIFVSQSLSNALVNGHVVDVDEFFCTDYSSVQITIGLGGILDPVLRAIRVQANKDKWKFNVKNADRVKWEQYKTASYDNFTMFFDEFTGSYCLSNLDSMWSVVHKAICFSVNEVFLKTWSKDFDGGFTKCSSHYYRLKLLVSKLVKASHSVSSNEFVFLLDVWVSLNFVNTTVIKFFFLLGSHFDAIRSALAKVRKSYYSLKIMELKHVRDSQIRLAINKKMENFELNKDQTIRSILEWPFCKVTLDHLVVNENLILEPGLVKFHVNRIMEDWTRKHVVVDNVSNK